MLFTMVYLLLLVLFTLMFRQWIRLLGKDGAPGAPEGSSGEQFNEFGALEDGYVPGHSNDQERASLIGSEGRRNSTTTNGEESPSRTRKSQRILRSSRGSVHGDIKFKNSQVGLRRPLVGAILYRGWLFYVVVLNICLALACVVLYGHRTSFGMWVSHRVWANGLCPEKWFKQQNFNEPTDSPYLYCSEESDLTEKEDKALRFGGVFLFFWFLGEFILIAFFAYDMSALFYEPVDLSVATVVAFVDFEDNEDSESNSATVAGEKKIEFKRTS